MKKEKVSVNIQNRYIRVAMEFQDLQNEIIKTREELGLMKGLLNEVLKKVNVDSVEKDIYEMKEGS